MSNKLEEAKNYLDESYDRSRELRFVALRATVRKIIEHLEEAGV